MDFSVTIIGAGVVGLAIAAEMAKYYSDVIVIEKNLKFGQGTSSRNSEVIHSGIYYPNGSLKARLCVKGKNLLYDYCAKNEIGFNRCGKLIVANNEREKKLLPQILNNALLNGVDEAFFLSAKEIKQLEPDISANSALYFPGTGIIDSHGLMKQLETDSINSGSQFVYGSEIISISGIKNGYSLKIRDYEGDVTVFSSKIVINSAGLFADELAKLSGTYEPSYEISFWKGSYFSLSGCRKNKISHLVYPVPEKDTKGLGIHATLDLGGRIKLGPDAEYLSDKVVDYKINPENRKRFYKSAKKYLPFIEEDNLVPDQCGIRPKLQKPGDKTRDFIIVEESKKGFPGLVNLIGIESPGLTSCLAIAKYVKDLLG